MCLADGQDIAVALTPTPDPTLWDLFGITTADGDIWTAETDTGTSCGSDATTPVPGRHATIISSEGPIAVGNARSVTVTVGSTSLVVPVPRSG